MEQQIRELCLRLLTTDEPDEFHTLAEELRGALHSHIEDMRERAKLLALADRLLLGFRPAK